MHTGTLKGFTRSGTAGSPGRGWGGVFVRSLGAAQSLCGHVPFISGKYQDWNLGSDDKWLVFVFAKISSTPSETA